MPGRRRQLKSKKALHVDVRDLYVVKVEWPTPGWKRREDVHPREWAHLTRRLAGGEEGVAWDRAGAVEGGSTEGRTTLVDEGYLRDRAANVGITIDDADVSYIRRMAADGVLPTVRRVPRGIATWALAATGVAFMATLLLFPAQFYLAPVVAGAVLLSCHRWDKRRFLEPDAARELLGTLVLDSCYWFDNESAPRNLGNRVDAACVAVRASASWNSSEMASHRARLDLTETKTQILETLVETMSRRERIGPRETDEDYPDEANHILAEAHRALDTVEEAVDQRVGRLETYVDDLTRLDKQREALRRIALVEDDADGYLDLLASVARDEHAAADLAGLSAEAHAVTTALRETVRKLEGDLHGLALLPSLPDIPPEYPAD